MALKIIPIFFSIFTGLYLFSWRHYALVNMHWSGVPSTLPLVLYAASGFEAACSLSCQIKNAERNGPLAIFISYGIMIAIAFTYQLAFYGALGNSLAVLQEYTGIFPIVTDFIARICFNGNDNTRQFSIWLLPHLPLALVMAYYLVIHGTYMQWLAMGIFFSKRRLRRLTGLDCLSGV